MSILVFNLQNCILKSERKDLMVFDKRSVTKNKTDHWMTIWRCHLPCNTFLSIKVKTFSLQKKYKKTLLWKLKDFRWLSTTHRLWEVTHRDYGTTQTMWGHGGAKSAQWQQINCYVWQVPARQECRSQTAVLKLRAKDRWWSIWFYRRAHTV